MRHNALVYIKISFAIIVATGLGIYAYIQSSNFLRGPIIEIYEPINGQTVEESLIQIIGRAKNVSILTLLDREISTDPEGNFNETLLLSPGYSILVMRARDRFGREVIKKLELIYKPEDTTTNEWLSTSTPLLP